VTRVAAAVVVVSRPIVVGVVVATVRVGVVVAASRRVRSTGGIVVVSLAVGTG